MDSFWEVLYRPLAQLRWEQQLVVALVVLCCIALVAWSVAFAVRSTRPRRLHERRLIGRPVMLYWRDSVGLKQSDDGLCQDLSTGGMALKLPFPLKMGTRLNFRLSEANLSGSGVVYRCTRIASRYAVGVKFDPLMRPIVSLQLHKA